jgi:hypothetical protein
MGLRLESDALEKLRNEHHPTSFLRLKSPQVVEYEFRGHFGHPSSYALVKFECLPATHLTFEAKATWPSTLTEEYIRSCEVSIAAGVADVLLQGDHQHRGCSIVLIEVRWDDVGGSAHAFRRATTAAMENLVKGKWELSA